MSRIRRLSIRGIRNFGNEGDEATIRFYRPLTLIFGPNGTGKTTIIEALKYASCGEFPPGSERGKFFVHDPHLTTGSTVRGVVKAEIIDRAGNEYTVCRTVSCTKTNAGIKMQTLDNTFSRKQKDTGKMISITNRCADIDKEVTLTMNVSKPILEYVVFCHQEDLNWPFLEGKKLKERFDEIFSTAAYNKALDDVAKVIKEMKQKIQVLQERKKVCELAVNDVESKENNLQDHKERLKRCDTKIDEMNKRLEPLDDNIRRLDELAARYKDLQAEEKKIKAEYDIYKKQMEKLADEIKMCAFEGSTEELLRHIKLYNERSEIKDIEVEEANKELRVLAGKEKKLSDESVNERVNINFMKQQIKEQETKIALRDRMLNEALSVWNLDNTGSHVTESEVRVLCATLEEKLRELSWTLKEKSIQREQKEKELQTVVDGLRSEYSKLDSQKGIKENELTDTAQEIREIQSELEKFAQAVQKLNTVEEKIRVIQTEIDRLNEAMDVDTEKIKISGKIKIRDESESLLNKVDEEIASLLKLSSLQAELELNKSSLRDKKEEVEKLRNKHQDTLKTLFDMNEMREVKLTSMFEALQKGLKKKIDSLDLEIQARGHKVATLETTVSHMKHEIEKKEASVKSKKDKVALICDYKNYDETLLSQSRKMKELQDKRGMYAHYGVAYKEYMRQLKEPSPCCPLCHRDFSEREAVTKLLKEMESDLENHPNRLKECDRMLRMQQERYDQMLQLKPDVESIIQFEEVEFEELTSNLKKTEEQLVVARTKVEQLKTAKEEPERKLTMCKTIQSDIFMWDRYIDEISNLKKAIDNYDARMAAAGIKTKRGLKEAQAQREELKSSLKGIRDEIEKLQSNVNAHIEKVNNARQQHNVLHEEQLKIRAAEQKTKELRQKQSYLSAKQIHMKKSLNALKEAVVEAKSKLDSAIDVLEAEKKKNSEQREIDRRQEAEESKRLSELRKVQDEIKVLLRRELSKSLKASESKIEEYQKLLNELSIEKRNLETRINDLKEENAHHDIRKRELADNLQFRKTEESVKKCQQQYSTVQEQIRSINYPELRKEYENLQAEKKSLLQNKDKLKGNMEELKRSIEQYTQELRKEHYRSARQRFGKVMADLWIATHSISALEEYTKQLDIAMIEYHESRMMKINKIMQELWKLVYTGKDTTSIQIRMDFTRGVGSRRRTYNYKLVQVKHGCEIDMRGRCSAGQKVLTSIIIRIALAETFCKKCGILALDEPTTNLDQANAESLATALDMIVKLRSRYQKNFQLVVISHDENFLRKLAILNTRKGYYRLYRKMNGFSAIEYTSVETSKVNSKESSSDEEPVDDPAPERDVECDADIKVVWDNSDQNIPSGMPSVKRRKPVAKDEKDSPKEGLSKKRFVFE